VRMVLAGHQLGRTFTDAFLNPAAQIAPMVQKKLQQIEVRTAELAAQRKVVSQPRVEVFDQGAAAGCLRHGLCHSAKDGLEFAAQFGAQSIPSLPVSGRCARLAVQHARGAHDVFRQCVGARDHRQLVVEDAGEREQIIALVLQRRAHRPDAARIIHLAPFHLGDDEIEHLFSDVQARTGQRQDVVGEPGGERSNVASQRLRRRFGLQGERGPVGKVRIMACFSGLGLQFFAPRPRPFGDAGQGVGQGLALMLNVEYVAVTR